MTGRIVIMGNAERDLKKILGMNEVVKPDKKKVYTPASVRYICCSICGHMGGTFHKFGKGYAHKKCIADLDRLISKNGKGR